MTIKNYRKSIVIGIVGALLFLTGSVQAYLHYYDNTQPSLSRDNLRAISMGAFLLIAEVVFLYGDVMLMHIRARGKRLVVGLAMATVALTMAWTIGSEFASSLTEKKSTAGIGAIEQYRDKELQTANTRRERRQVRMEASGMVKEVIAGVTAADVRAYLANFVVALIALVIFQFCDEDRRQRRKPVGIGGDQIPIVPGLAAQVEKKISMAPEAAKAYAVDGGWAIHANGEYQGFVPESALEKDQNAVKGQ